MSIHNLTIFKRAKNLCPIFPAKRHDPIVHKIEADLKATCSCGWSGDWHSTEQLAREEYGKHIFMGVKSPFLRIEKDWP